MIERLTGQKSSDQLSLPISWQSVVKDPGILEMEEDIDRLAKPQRPWEADYETIKNLQLNIAVRALRHYGVEEIREAPSLFPEKATESYGLVFDYTSQTGNKLYSVSTNWYSNERLSVTAWNRGLGQDEGLEAWGIYEEVKRWMIASASETTRLRRQDSQLYESILVDLYDKFGFSHFKAKALKEPINPSRLLQTKNTLSAALHLIDTPVADTLPIRRPDQGYIEVTQPGRILYRPDIDNTPDQKMSRPSGQDIAFTLNPQGAFERT
jgi:hypothetical protein